MIELLDYILDYDDNFWIVNSIEDDILGYIVYSVSENGNHYNHITHKYYKKNYPKDLSIIPPHKQIFKPQEFYQKNKNTLNGVWLKYIEVLNDIGISDKDIGIFGSYLIGFDVIKDIDFVIYGVDNLHRYYKYNDYIKESINATYITDEHVKHQYKKHKDNYSPKTDLKKIIRRNWSGVQIKKGVLSTPRFIDKKRQKIHIDLSNKKIIQCEVIDGFETSLLPRRAKVKINDQEYELISSLWKYQSYLKNSDIIECCGYIDEKNHTIFLKDTSCYVHFLNNID